MNMTKEINVIEALRHNRHDWLNVMQLVKTNLALGNYESTVDSNF